MKYEEVKRKIQTELLRRSSGATWQEIRINLALPYKSLCPEWTKLLESEIGLVRKRGKGRAFVWSIDKKGD